MAVHTFDLFADYFQFYIQDEDASGIDGDAWVGDAPERMLAVSPGAIGVGTVRNVDVPVTVEVLDAEPPNDAESWDHVTECSLTTASGKLVVAGCTDYFPEAARISVSPGTYRARISGGGFDTVDEHSENGADRYRIQLWPGSDIDARVVKQRQQQSA